MTINLEHLQFTLDITSTDLYEFDPSTGVISHFGDKFFRNLGYGPGEIPQDLSEWLNLVHEEDRSSVISVLNGNTYISGPFELHYRFLNRAGQIRHFLDKGTKRLDPASNKLKIIGLISDITERKLSKEQLLAAEAKFRTLVEQIPAVTYIASVNDYRHKFYVSPQIEALLGLPPSAVEDRPHVWQERIHPEDQERVHAEILKNQHSGGSFLCEYRMVTQNGDSLWFHDEGILVKDENDRPLFVQGIMLNITESKLAEKALVESEERNRFLIEASPIGIGIIRESKLIYVNSAFTQSFGYPTADEILGRHLRDLIHPSNRDSIESILKNNHDELPPNSTSVSFELKAIKKNGQIFDLALWPRCIDYFGKPAIMAFLADRTEAGNLKAQLLQSQKMEAIGTLAGGIAHDFNNLLTVILGYSELIMSEKNKDHREYEDLKRIVHAARTAGSLVQQILAFSRKTETKPYPINLNQHVDQLRKMLLRLIPKNINMEFRLTPCRPIINADPCQIDQLLINLVVNARDAMPNGGMLNIEIEVVDLQEDFCRTRPGIEAGQYAVLTIGDTGTGIDESALYRIFEPFYTTKKPGEGTGLGLAMVYGFVRNHGGHIECSSKQGNGTKFTIYLPLHETEATPDLEITTCIERNGSGTILVVDDEEHIRSLAARILKKAGYKVLSAKDGREAIRLFSARHSEISAVLLDLIMPVLDGRQCLKELLKIDPNAKVLISSGYAPENGTKESLDDLVKGFVWKPYNSDHLIKVLKNIL